jgi:2'-5' RNA ligase
MIRLFVGLELPATVRQMLHLLQGGIPGARWTEPGNHHMTLCFIGEVDEPVAADIDDALDEIRDHAFTLQVAGLGQFDRGGHTKIIWAGIRTNPALEHLQEKVRVALDRRGLPVENRKFTPHITLARLGAGAQQPRIMDFLAGNGLFSTPPFQVEHFTLFESLRGGGAPVYRPIRLYKLFE